MDLLHYTPGTIHGKSVMAAFVIGTNPKLRDGILLGWTVVFILSLN
ncbi:MAG: hypothetical protein WCF28_09460 [Methanobacterium sp.]